MKVISVLSLFIYVVNVKFTITVESESVLNGIGSIFEAIGFSPTCVSQSLSLCEKNRTNSVSVNDIVTQLNRTQALIQSLEDSFKRPRNCADLYEAGDRESGIRTVYPFTCCNNRPVTVKCNHSNDGGGWTVFQHRGIYPEREDFFRNWIEYKLGFGNLNKEFWLGLDNIQAMVSEELMELRIDLEDFEGNRRWAKYSYFYISPTPYYLDLGTYSGNAGNGFEKRHIGHAFSTKDKDNDISDLHCAQRHRGAWWYDQCHISNLNGFHFEGNHSSYADGINWEPFKGYYYSLKETYMSVRPKNFM